MWICLNTGFLGVIADKDPAKLIVLARRKRDLLNTFGQDANIVETIDGHYRWRALPGEVQVAGQIGATNYTNFNSRGSISSTRRRTVRVSPRAPAHPRPWRCPFRSKHANSGVIGS